MSPLKHMFHRENSIHPSDHREWKNLERRLKNATMPLTFSPFLRFFKLLFVNPRVKLRSQYSCRLNSFAYKSSSSRCMSGSFAFTATRKALIASSVSIVTGRMLLVFILHPSFFKPIAFIFEQACGF